jgi:hypothetical protein
MTAQEKRDYYINEVGIDFTLKTFNTVDGITVESTRAMTVAEIDEALTHSLDKDVREANLSTDISYRRGRTEAYSSTDDQLDAIYKGFKAIKDADNGISLGADTDSWVDSITTIKEAFVKGEDYNTP